MKIKHYKLKQDLTREELINFGAREGGFLGNKRC